VNRLAVTIASAAAAVVALSGCGLLAGPPTDATTNQPIDLEAAEVRQYEGKRLDSVADFRENSIKGPQDVPLNDYTLEVTGKVATPLTLSYEDAIDRQAYKKVVTLNCVEGWSVDILWEGVRIADLLEQAGYDKGAKTVIFRCYDGYTTSLPLAKVVDHDLLLAYKMNGIDLPKERGFPFQVVAEDQWGYKWAKWVTEIEVSDDTDFKGYWESRGYENDATLPGLESSPAETSSP
jgi:DMSO/TMAO reductase YedYZ molybdopterin-dependent catalytic subunit